MQRISCFHSLVLAVLLAAPLAATAGPGRYLKQGDSWYSSPEGRKILDNVLSWQSPQGSWPKNLDTTARPFAGEFEEISGTFDNRATTDELRLLARAFVATNEVRYQTAFLKGFDHILKAQYPNGGWPQYYPPGNLYPRYITFNDGAMLRLLEFLREVATQPQYRFVDDARRKAAQESFDRGIQCILKCQVVVNGRKTVWCAQHDEVDLRPQGARKYELPSLSGSESAGILLLLMSLKNPAPEVRAAIDAGAAWFESAKITDLRIQRINGERTAVRAPNATPLWARFYELETGKPLFSDRDGLKRYDYNEISRERRNGYAWLGSWGQGVAQQYAKWQKRWPAPK